ncbi:MAG: cyclase family protein [Alphaproteobacteria bacterium]|nr:cyclase family protein [Alphaproteobacteria bacterium]
MATLIDLSIPIASGAGRLGLQVEMSQPFSFANCGWQGTMFTMFAHYASHVDAPVHFIEGAKSIDQAPLSQLLGPASLVDLSDHGEGKGITGDVLEDRGKHVRRGDIAILRTDWSDKTWETERFWKEGPYLSLQGADWLVERGVRAVVYDFAEEFAVRKPNFQGKDCPVHHRILGQEIYNIEYVHRLSAIRAPRLALMALPIKLVGSDGAPARVVAIEGADLPSEFAVR